MARILAQVSLQAASQLPEDRMVNTLWFQTNPSADPELIPPVIEDFYQELSTLMSDQALSETGHLVKLYDHADIEPRAPIFEYAFALPALASSIALPAEVALCSSFQGAPQSGQNQQQR